MFTVNGHESSYLLTEPLKYWSISNFIYVLFADEGRVKPLSSIDDYDILVFKFIDVTFVLTSIAEPYWLDDETYMSKSKVS